MKISNLLIVMGIAGIALNFVGCTRPDEARKVLGQAGYTDIKPGGYCVFCCSKDDTFHTEFTAKGPTGQPVSGVVCSGWMKGSTIRLF